jgi:ABC-2 type transport system permease protein
LVAGDTIAGEAGRSTLRYLLVAPAGRVRCLLLVKYAGVSRRSVAATAILTIAGLLIGAVLFPLARQRCYRAMSFAS